ncbi:Eco57I restriction-modification methylase domain-containing protein [Lactiplantibacillus fabifermentans]|uniref:Eco57I restriction-modification methylase domain-containing protein n=1 Tax=Lactiplantibacillus fabifermentans TaxID=483011 RepID=UPI0004B9E1B0|nr:Eco57I restriction-modification methylase domain-containing protein [Lactiplantibacillus fabifermentans]
MKFDIVVGNPPYQEETHGRETANGQKRVKSIFPVFQELADTIANDSACLIYPGGRWIHRSGKGMTKFGLAQINDPHLKTLMFFKDSGELFEGVGIPDGVSVVLKDYHKTDDKFEYEYFDHQVHVSVTRQAPGEDLMQLNPQDQSIVARIDEFVASHNLPYLHDSVFSQKLFQIESDFVEKHPEDVTPYNGQMFDPKHTAKVLTNDKAGKSGRANWFLVDRSKIPTNNALIDEFQVIVSSANAGGQKRSNQIDIADNHSAFGRARLALKSFKTEVEAKNFLKYANSNLIKFAFLMTDESLTSLAKKVPDLVDYTDSNKYLNYSLNIDNQLNKLFGITDQEQDYIVSQIPNRD